ncbi:helix-turn-helix domain-containing protein [Paenibacillus caui]|uniref:helix-turn-helix domain-containing protein n=1 Tax=Paenibacillus caui TaxID=2873927 RepID=UPI001CA9E078|nr:helix-turn-helix domain-containing protein [Paenibacillus caui]
MREVMNRKEAAKVAGVSPGTILRAIQARQLDAVKIGGGRTSAYIIERTNLMKYLEKKKESKYQ